MKLRYIDAIRGIAILLVIMTHSFQIFDLGSKLNAMFSMGAKGVQMFFVASSFTLFLSFNHRKNTEERYIRNFFIRRFFRIAPMYYIGICFFFLTKEMQDSNQLASIISNIFFIHGINPLWISSIVPGGWSISAEMIFYLLVPFLAIKIKNTNQSINFILFSYIISMLFRIILIKYPLVNNERLMDVFIYSNLINQLPIFGIGILSYFLILKKDYRIKVESFFVIFLLLISHMIWNVFLTNTLLFSLLWVLLIFILSIKEFKFLVNRFTVFMGKISYSSYLIHFAVLRLIRPFVKNQYLDNVGFALLYFIFIILVTAIISRLTYTFIEIPFQKFGKRIIKHF